LLNIFKKIKDIFRRDFLFFVKTDNETEVSQDKSTKTSEIYYKGAWEEDGAARWAFFKVEDDANSVSNENTEAEKDYSTTKLDGSKLVIKEETLEYLKDKVSHEKLKFIEKFINKEIPIEDLIENLKKLSFDNKEIRLILYYIDKSAFQDFLEELLLTPEEDSGEVIPDGEEVVSITDLGRNLVSRYQTASLNNEDTEKPEGKECTPLPEKAPEETIKKEQIERHEKILEIRKTDIDIKALPVIPVLHHTQYTEEEEPAKVKIKKEEHQFDGLVDQRDLVGESRKIRVFFAEDNRSFQIILRTLINKTEAIELTGCASDGKEAIDKLKNSDTHPDVILMDIAMPRINGIEATREILKINPNFRVVMLTAFGDKEHVQKAFEAGAIGFLRKDAGLPLIKEAIKQAARGGRPVHKEVSKYLE